MNDRHYTFSLSAWLVLCDNLVMGSLSLLRTNKPKVVKQELNITTYNVASIILVPYIINRCPSYNKYMYVISLPWHIPKCLMSILFRDLEIIAC